MDKNEKLRSVYEKEHVTSLYEHKLPHSICVSNFIWFPETFIILFFIIDERNHDILVLMINLTGITQTQLGNVSTERFPRLDYPLGIFIGDCLDC